MAENLPRSITTSMQFENGPAIGISNRWVNGQYCSILTPIGIVGCGIYDVVVPAEFNQALAVAQGAVAASLYVCGSRSRQRGKCSPSIRESWCWGTRDRGQ